MRNIHESERIISLKGRELIFTFRVSTGARRLRLAVHAGGRLIVTAPRWVSLDFVENFIREKESWLLKSIEKSVKESETRIPDIPERYRQYRKEALCLLEERLRLFSPIYGYKYRRVSVKNQKTRWGSCSSQGNLNFNYRVVFLPIKLVDYIVVHELCHLAEMNHSPRFWQLVQKTIPDYKLAKKELNRRKLLSV